MNDTLQPSSWIKLDERWGSDDLIATRARVSTGSVNKGWAQNLRLLSYLVRENHGSPLEFAGIVFHARLPLFLVVQLLRHRIASYSEQSGRFQHMELEFYIPPVWYQTKEGLKQTEGEVLSEEDSLKAYTILSNHYLLCEKTYNELIALNITPGQARIVLPTGLMKELYIHFNLRSLMNFLSLRMAPDAQKDWAPYVEEMTKIFAEEFLLLGGKIFPILRRVENAQRKVKNFLWKDEVDSCCSNL